MAKLPCFYLLKIYSMKKKFYKVTLKLSLTQDVIIQNIF